MISRSVASPYRHSVSSSPFASYITRSFPKTASSPLKGTSYSSPRRSFCTETSCRKPSPRRGASAWALSPGRSLDMIETAVPQRKSVDLGRVGSGMEGIMGLFARRKKVDPAEEEMVHRLRIILAQLVQWRFVNARADAAMNRQRFVSERKLFYAWLRLAEMRNVVTAKRVLLQRGRLKLKLQSMLIVQVKLLMKWEQVARPHVDAVAVLGKVLGVTCLSLPLVQGAQANIVSLHRCLRVSMDIMKDIEAKAKIFYSMMEDVSLRANLIQATKSEDEKLALSKPLALHRASVCAFVESGLGLRPPLFLVESNCRDSSDQVNCFLICSIPDNYLLAVKLFLHQARYCTHSPE
ncbi:QWRF motif-containing protein 7 [Carex littledalei]|uniref:QWRF motif-containing protein 7 n=1 Tax=Carex littledalei TaxID=544730 RepID=A0A833VE01_9POAL|nr:QWRF motif-containing protein 7 [Carex littledalei]